jgi:hypothetical protein
MSVMVKPVLEEGFTHDAPVTPQNCAIYPSISKFFDLADLD